MNIKFKIKAGDYVETYDGEMGYVTGISNFDILYKCTGDKVNRSVNKNKPETVFRQVGLNKFDYIESLNLDVSLDKITSLLINKVNEIIKYINEKENN